MSTKNNVVSIQDEIKDAEKFEKEHVKNVYNKIAPHFSATRITVRCFFPLIFSLGLYVKNF